MGIIDPLVRAQSLTLQVNGQALTDSVLTYSNTVAQLSGLVRMSDGTTNARVVFQSSDSTVATVDARGYLIATRTGQVSLTATSQDDPGVSAPLTVRGQAITGVDTLQAIRTGKPVVELTDRTSGGGNIVAGPSSGGSAGSTSSSAATPVPTATPKPAY